MLDIPLHYTHACVCVHACVHTCTHTFTPVYMRTNRMLWCKDKTSGIFCSFQLYFFKTVSFTQPEANHWTLRDLLVSTSNIGVVSTCTHPKILLVWGFEPRPSFLKSKHFYLFSHFLKPSPKFRVMKQLYITS